MPKADNIRRQVNKKILAIVILSLVVLGSLVGLRIYPYLEDQNSKQNNISIGEAKVDIEEEYEMPETFEADTTYDKLANITNTGECDVFVRVSAEASDSNVAELIINDSDWKLADDGYYYYKGLLKSGSTINFMTGFKSAEKIKTKAGQTKDKFDETAPQIVTSKWVGDEVKSPDSDATEDEINNYFDFIENNKEQENNIGTQIYIYAEAWEAEKTEDELGTSEISSEKILELVKNNEIFKN